MNYALLIYRSAPLSEPTPDATERAALAAHRTLQREASERGELGAVARLAERDTARTVRRRASGHDVSDGPFMETKEWLVGFYVVECESEAQALDRARQLCNDDHHAIEVRPITFCWKP